MRCFGQWGVWLLEVLFSEESQMGKNKNTQYLPVLHSNCCNSPVVAAIAQWLLYNIHIV